MGETIGEVADVTLGSKSTVGGIYEAGSIK